MRATCCGARSGRIWIVTGPFDVSRINVSSVLLMGCVLRVLVIVRVPAIVDDGDDEGPSGDGAAEPVGQRQRLAAIEHLGRGTAIGGAHVLRRLVGDIGEPRRAEHLAGLGKSEPHGDPHAGPGDILRRQHEAFRQHRRDFIQPVERLVAVGRLRRIVSHVELEAQFLSERIEYVRHAAGPAVDAAEVWRAGMVVEHAALRLAFARRRDDADCQRGQRQYPPIASGARHLTSAATRTLTILSGAETVPLACGSPFLSLSTTSMPDSTWPITVYLPFRKGPSANMMKNWLLAELGSLARAMPRTPRVNGTFENSAGRSGYLEPPVPLPFWPSPVCAMKPVMTRWNGTL